MICIFPCSSYDDFDLKNNKSYFNNILCFDELANYKNMILKKEGKTLNYKSTFESKYLYNDFNLLCNIDVAQMMFTVRP